jgi:hypothetical protein
VKLPRPSKEDNPSHHLRRDGKRRTHRQERRRVKKQIRRADWDEEPKRLTPEQERLKAKKFP